MTEIGVIENKISSIKKYLKILERYSEFTKEEIFSDIDKKGAVERYLYLLSQATIDLAEAVIALKGFRKPATFSETFDILSEERVIPRELRLELVKMAGFRNILAHEYAEIDYEILYDVLIRKTKDIEEFISAVQSKIL